MERLKNILLVDTQLTIISEAKEREKTEFSTSIQ
jgi:hypothetical protein